MAGRWRRREFLIALGGVPGLLGLDGVRAAEPRASEDFDHPGYPTSLRDLRPEHLALRRLTREPSEDRSGVVLSLLEHLAGEQCWNFPVSEQLHARQAATRAFHDDPGDEEAVVAALCHDAGGLVGSPHARASAMLLDGYVREELVQVVAHHTLFQRRFREAAPPPWLHRFDEHLAYRDEPWFELAMTFTERWDQPSFDPRFETLPLGHFEPMVRRVFGRRRSGSEAAPRDV